MNDFVTMIISSAISMSVSAFILVAISRKYKWRKKFWRIVSIGEDGYYESALWGGGSVILRGIAVAVARSFTDDITIIYLVSGIPMGLSLALIPTFEEEKLKKIEGR